MTLTSITILTTCVLKDFFGFTSMNLQQPERKDIKKSYSKMNINHVRSYHKVSTWMTTSLKSNSNTSGQIPIFAKWFMKSK